MNITEICMPNRIYTLPEAQCLVPLFQRVTSRHENAVQELIDRMKYLAKSGAKNEMIDNLQKQVNEHMVKWGTKIRKLGGIPLAGGAVGIDGGGWYWSWFYGEKIIEHYHPYYDSPGNRIKLTLKK
jgi:Uncharacterized conserved protein (DUF2203)